MTITNGYCTLAEFKAYMTVRLGTTSTDAADDAVIEDIVETVSRHIDKFTGRRFYKNTSDETRYYAPRDSFLCYVDDLVSVTTLSVDYANTRSYTDLTASDYELLPDNAALLGLPYTSIAIHPTSSAYFPEIRKGVKVVGVFGFSAVPDNIKTDTLAIVLNLWKARQGQVSAGRMTVSVAGVTVMPEHMPDWVREDLVMYRRRT